MEAIDVLRQRFGRAIDRIGHRLERFPEVAARFKTCTFIFRNYPRSRLSPALVIIEIMEALRSLGGKPMATWEHPPDATWADQWLGEIESRIGSTR